MNNNTVFDESNLLIAHMNEDVTLADNKVKHCHPRYEIVYVVRGTGKFVLEGHEVQIIPGALFFVKPFQYHYLVIEEGITYERYTLHFYEKHLTETAKVLFEKYFLQKNSCNFYKIPPYDSIANLFERFHIGKTLDVEQRVPFWGVWISELIILLSAHDGSVRNLDDKKININIIEYLNNNFEKPLDLNLISKRFSINKSHLCRTFKQHNGITVLDYLHMKRTILAKQMIENGALPKDTYKKVGFNDYTTFYRACIKFLHKSPKDL